MGANSCTDKGGRILQKSVSEKLRDLLLQFEPDDTTTERRALVFVIDPLNKSFISPRDSKDKKNLSLLRDDGIIVHKSDANDPNLFLEKFDLDEDDKLNIGLCEGENEESRETAKALWGDDFDNGYSLFQTLQTKRRLFLKAQRLMKNVANFCCKWQAGSF